MSNLKAVRRNTFFKFVLVLVAFMLLGSNLSADEFDAVNDILGNGSKAGKSALGTGMQWGLSIVLPLICIIAGAIMGYSQQKKKAEQEQNTNKIYMVTAISAVVGFFVYVIVTMILSRALFGDASFAFNNVIFEFFKDAVNSAK